MKLNIQPLSQRDPRWSRKILDSQGTIGNYGCLLACHAMMLTYFGHDLLPDALNGIYKEKDVFDGNLINFYAAADCFDDVTAKEFYNCYDIPCNLKKIDEQLEKKIPVIALVDFDPKPGIQTHFVLVIGKAEDGAYLINDPWTGETYFFNAKYGDPARYIFGLRIYEGTPKKTETPEDTISDLRQELRSTKDGLAEALLKQNELDSKLKKQEADNKDLAGQLLEARSERDKEAWAKDQEKIKVERLTDEKEKLKVKVDQYKEEIKQLKIDLRASKGKLIKAMTKWEALSLTISKFLKGGG